MNRDNKIDANVENLLYKTKIDAISTLAHHWRQPLNIISINVSCVEDLLAIEQIENEKYELFFNKIHNTIEYMSNIIDLFYEKYQIEEKKYFNLKKVFNEIYDLFKIEFEENNIEYKLFIDKDVKIYGNEKEFLRAILNILNNAKEKVLENNTKRFITVKCYIKDNHLIILIKNNGNLLSIEEKKRLFEPYFSTKNDYHFNIGLSLYITRKIIKESFCGVVRGYNRDNFVEFCIKIPMK